MLLIALGLVIATMRQLNKPSTALRLEQIFGATDAVTQRDSARQFVLDMDQTDRRDRVALATDEPINSSVPASAAEAANDAMARVQDNTYFRPAEQEAWFTLLEDLQLMQPEEVVENSLGELTYTQLLKQPDVYRGRIVTVSGTLRREEVEQAPANEAQIESYHRLVIQPRGGGNWPFIVYCLDLPAELPRGDDLKSVISVHGYFFKNWSYAWQGGLGVAPVVLARSVDWQPSAPRAPQRTISVWSLTIALLIAGGIAAASVWLAIRNTRRPTGLGASEESMIQPDSSAAETIHQQLQALAEAEARE